LVVEDVDCEKFELEDGYGGVDDGDYLYYVVLWVVLYLSRA